MGSKKSTSGLGTLVMLVYAWSQMPAVCAAVIASLKIILEIAHNIVGYEHDLVGVVIPKIILLVFVGYGSLHVPVFALNALLDNMNKHHLLLKRLKRVESVSSHVLIIPMLVSLAIGGAAFLAAPEQYSDVLVVASVSVGAFWLALILASYGVLFALKPVVEEDGSPSAADSLLYNSKNWKAAMFVAKAACICVVGTSVPYFAFRQSLGSALSHSASSAAASSLITLSLLMLLDVFNLVFLAGRYLVSGHKFVKYSVALVAVVVALAVYSSYTLLLPLVAYALLRALKKIDKATHSDHKPRFASLVTLLYVGVVGLVVLSSFQTIYAIHAEPPFVYRDIHAAAFDIDVVPGGISSMAHSSFAWREGDSRPGGGSHLFCHIEPHGVSLVDAAFAAQLAYLNPQGRQGLSSKLFPGWSIQERALHSTAVFYELRRGDVSIVTIRGTDVLSAADIVQDIDVWLENSLFQVASQVVPMLSVAFSGKAQHDLISILSSVEHMLPQRPSRYYHLPVAELVNELKESGQRVVVVGHSLGGGMAALVGALTKTPAISFSGPGMHDVRHKFNLEAKHLNEFVTVVQPDHDIVPMIGRQSGAQIQIECIPQRPDLCHLPAMSICELISLCGHKNRTFTQCTFEY